MKETKVITTWTCDRCKVSKISENRPCDHSDSWGTLMIDQDIGFDVHGYPWAPRMYKPVLLCGKCIEIMMDALKNVN